MSFGTLMPKHLKQVFVRGIKRASKGVVGTGQWRWVSCFQVGFLHLWFLHYRRCDSSRIAWWQGLSWDSWKTRALSSKEYDAFRLTITKMLKHLNGTDNQYSFKQWNQKLKRNLLLPRWLKLEMTCPIIYSKQKGSEDGGKKFKNVGV